MGEMDTRRRRRGIHGIVNVGYIYGSIPMSLCSDSIDQQTSHQSPKRNMDEKQATARRQPAYKEPVSATGFTVLFEPLEPSIECDFSSRAHFVCDLLLTSISSQCCICARIHRSPRENMDAQKRSHVMECSPIRPKRASPQETKDCNPPWILRPCKTEACSGVLASRSAS